MSTDGLAPPGSSSYTSNTMHVGDGTWDKSRDDFLLPNLQGLNFATMRYNGMSNRFKGEAQYHTLVLGHGVLAAITFLGIMPIAIFLAKYGHDWPGGRVSFKMHVYLQILTVFLSTVVLVLGWFAVGPQRSLTNPHHGIGVAIYVLILFQFIYASCWFRRERRRKTAPVKLPLTVWLHRLLGRSTALLAFVEVALGLTLYGSPKYLFVLYSLWGALLLFLYLALEYHYLPRSDVGRPGPAPSEFYSDYGSAISGSRLRPQQQQRPPKQRHWGRDLLAAGGMIGAYEWWRRRNNTKRDRLDEKQGGQMDSRYDGSMVGPPPHGAPPLPVEGGMGGPVGPHGQPGGPHPHFEPPLMAGGGGPRHPHDAVSRDSWEDDDKYDDRRARPKWGTRILEATGAFAAFEGARNLFGRRRHRDDDYTEDGSYGSALGGNRPIPSEADVSRVQAGHAPVSPGTPRVDMHGPQPHSPTMTPSRPPRGAAVGGDSVSMDSRDHYGVNEPAPLLVAGAPLSEHIRELGPIAGLREWNRARRIRKETDRAEAIRQQELENEESFNRRNSNNYPRPQDASHRRMSTSGTLLTGPSAPGNSEMSRTNIRPDTSHPPLPADAATIPQGYSIPPPPPGPPPNALRSDGYGSNAAFGSAQMPSGAIDPDPARILRDNTAANESSAYGRDRIRDDLAGAAAAGAVGAGLGAAATRYRDHSRGQSGSPSRTQDSRGQFARGSRRGSAAGTSASMANSPPVSVQVKMHNDGRHVTLRRLNDEEVAAGREARRQERRQRRGSSMSSDGEPGPSAAQRFRRNVAGASSATGATAGPSTGGVRASSAQPIRNVPAPPPAMSNSSFRRESSLNLPPPAAPMHSSPASAQALSPPHVPLNESGAGYGTDVGTGTDVSAFADNRRRRRAERARRQEAEAARGAGERGTEFD